MSESRQSIPAEGISRLTLDVTGADVSVRWVENLDSVTVIGAELSSDIAGDELYLYGNLRRVHDDDDDDEIRILGYESPGQMVEDILKQTGLFSGLGLSRRSVPLHIQMPYSIESAVLDVNQYGLTLEEPQGKVDCKLKRGEFNSSGGIAELNVSSGSGDVEVTGLKGSLRVSSGSGDTSLNDVEAIINVKAGSGDVSLTRVRAEAIKLAAGSGDLDIINCHAVAYSSDCGSGDVLISGGLLSRINIRTGSGEVRCSASFGPYAQSIATGSGSVSLGVPRDLSARIEAFTSSGDIDSELPLVSVGQRGPKSRRSRRQVGSVGSGEPRAEVSLRTTSGDIRLHWLPSVNETAPIHARPPAPPQPPEQPGTPIPVPAPQSARAEASDTTPLRRHGGAMKGDQREVILQALANGEITVDEADLLLSKIDSDSNTDR